MLVRQDLRNALRSMRKSPGFTATVVLTLALGIGANSAIFSVVDAVLIRPLPYADAARLVMVWEDASRVGFPQNTPAPANWVDFRTQNTVFTDIAASRGSSFNLSGDGPPEQVFARRVTGNFWTVLGAKPLLGRIFTDDEDRQQTPVAVLSFGLWQRRFGGDAGVIGRKILLNDKPHTILGVMPREFYFLPSRLVDVWTPANFSPQDLANRGSHFLNCVARLKEGVTLGQAQAEMQAIARRIAAQHASARDLGAVVVPLRDQLAGSTKTALLVLLGGAGCLLLIACANVANLLLARGAARQRELAVRAALGAGRGRLVRQLLTESLALSALGAVAGLALAGLAMRFLETLVPLSMIAAPLSLDLRVLTFTSAATVLAGLLFGAAPALSVARFSIHDTLKQGGRGSTGSGREWVRDSLVVAETALALVLLTGAGLLIQSLYRLQQVDLGMHTDKVLTLFTILSRYPQHSQREAFYNSVLERVRALPGVVNAGYISSLPLTERGNTSGYILQGQDEKDTATQDALFRVVTADYFQTMGVRVREGRLFSSADRANTELVTVVNETFADRHFRGRSALGTRLQMANWGPKFPWYTIVGVVKEIRERGIDVDLKPAVYLAHPQAAQAWPIPYALAIRTAVEPAALTSAVRQAIWAVDKDQPISRIRTMEQVVGTELALPRQNSALLGAFAGLAVVLACLGIYGVLSYAVAQRTNEIGVRMALGATPGSILTMVARRGLTLTAAGLVIGIAASVAAGRVIATLLFGVRPNDPLTVVAVSAVLVAVAFLACLVPARRASRIDPVVALREE